MKGFYKHVLMIFTLIVCLFFLASPSQSYYAGPSSYPYYQPPVNINITLGGFPGGYSSGFPSWTGPNYFGGIYGMGGLYGPSYGLTSSSKYVDTNKFSFKCSAADGDYIYVAFGEAKGKGRQALAIFEASGSDAEYLSHVTLGDTLGDIPEKIIVRGDLAVIGAYSGGTVFLIDISDKEEPELINKLVLGKKYDGRGRVTSLAIEDEVLFVSIEFDGDDKHIIFSLDISEPEETDEDDDLLGSYEMDDDDYQEIYNMVSVPGYLYIAAKYKDDPTILIMDISEPDDLSLAETLDMNGEKEVSIAINGDYLLTTVQVEDYGLFDFDEGTCEFKVIDISGDPENPEIISSSEEFSGRHTDWYENIVIKDNYAYVFVTTLSPTETKIYVFDISNPEAPDLVEKSKSIDGLGAGLYFVDDRLCLQTSKIITMFDISNPEDISVDETVDLHDILEDELDGWGVDRSSSSYYGGYPLSGWGYSGWGGPSYGGYTPPSPWEDQYLCTGLGHCVPIDPEESFFSGYSGWGGPSYGGYGPYGYSGWSGPSYGGYGSYGYSGWGGPSYGGYGPYGYSGWGGGPSYGGYGPYGYSGWGGGPSYGGYGPYGYSGWGGPSYGNYGPGWGYSGWGNWY